MDDKKPVMTIDNGTAKKRRPKKGLIVFLVILFLLIALFLVANYVFFTPEKIVKRNINSMFTSMKISVKNYYENNAKYDFDKESVDFKGNLTLNSNYKKDGLDFTKLKNYTVNYDVVIDKPNNKVSALFDVKRLNKDFMSIKSYNNGKYSILDLGDLYNRTVKTDGDLDIKNITATAASEKDVLTLLDRINEFAVNHVSNDKITKKMGKFEVNGKNSFFTRINYEINEDNYNNDFYKFLRDDDKAFKALQNITGKKEMDLFDELETNIIFDEDLTKDVSEFNFYYKLLPLKANYIEVNDEDESFVFEPLKNKINVTGYYKKEKNMDAYYEYDTSKLFIDYADKDDKSSLKLDMIIKEESINGTIDYIDDKDSVNLKIDSKTSFRKNNDSKTETKVDFNYKGEEYSFDLTAVANSEIKTKVKPFEIKEKNTISYNEFNEKDDENIQNAFANKMIVFLNDIAPELLK